MSRAMCTGASLSPVTRYNTRKKGSRCPCEAIGDHTQNQSLTETSKNPQERRKSWTQGCSMRPPQVSTFFRRSFPQLNEDKRQATERCHACRSLLQSYFHCAVACKEANLSQHLRRRSAMLLLCLSHPQQMRMRYYCLSSGYLQAEGESQLRQAAIKTPSSVNRMILRSRVKLLHAWAATWISPGRPGSFSTSRAIDLTLLKHSDGAWRLA
eukprot:1772283-Amphidinium_carterae.1